VTPRAALIFLPSPTQSFKYLYGNAFRAPNESELSELNFNPLIGSPKPESIDTHELVWERYINDRLRTSMSTYWYKADDLITSIDDDIAPRKAVYVNQGQVKARGVEMEAQIRLKGDSRALVSYALQSAIDQEKNVELPNSPRHVAKARISFAGPTPRSFISFEGQYLSSRATLRRDDLDGGFKFEPRVPGAATLNMSVVQPLGRSWELFGSVRNIFDNEYLDPVSIFHRQEAIPQNGRTARIGLTWKLWQP
jgi:iron complex outermembrane receptor protein